MAVLRCCECKRLFVIPDDEVVLCTEAVCGTCFSGRPACNSGPVDSFAGVLALLEGNYGEIDGGRLADEIADEYYDG